MNHPLTDEMCEKIQLHIFNQTNPDCIRAGADWQLEQVIEWVKHCRGYRLELASETWKFVQDLKAAMRPQQQEES